MNIYYTPAELVLCRSDAGDGGWSLHAAGSSDDDIADGRAPCLLSGTASWDADQDDWDRPNVADYAAASIRHEGRILIDMIPRIYDTQRILRVLGEDGGSDVDA